MLKQFTSELQSLLPVTPVKIAVAISGGGDSFSLLHLVKETGLPIIALTVDHQLRVESKDEANSVHAWCLKNNIEHHIIEWHHYKPTTGIQAKARKARRELLIAACMKYGATHLFLGHQADDQAETMLMRLQRGTGLNGFKAIRPVTQDKHSGTFIVRPLLNQRRSELRQYCIDHQLPFIDDPSNENLKFERIRIRQALEYLPQLADGVAKTSHRLARANDTLNKLATSWIDIHEHETEKGNRWLPSKALKETLPEIKLRILEQCCPKAKLPQLEQLVIDIHHPEFSGVTLGPTWIKPKIFQKQAGFVFQNAPKRRS